MAEGVGGPGPACGGPPAETPKPLDPADPQEPQACYHPWMRLLARGLDMTLYRMVFDVIALGVFRAVWLLELPVLVNWLGDILFLALALALEPFWLHFWGWTPGKWIFGLKLRDQYGNKLSVTTARERSWRLAWEGYRWNIPIWDLITKWRCRGEGLEGRNCDWDLYSSNRYTKVERRWYGLWYVVALNVCIGVAVAVTAFAVLQSYMPVNQGPLTVVDFAENYNHYVDMWDYVARMDSDGGWHDQAEDGIFVLDMSGLDWLDPEYTVKDGYVTAVTFRVQSAEDFAGFIFTSHTPENLGLLAMSGGVNGLDLFNYELQGWLDFWDREDGYSSFEADYRGLHISQQVEQTGYESVGEYLIAVEGQEQFYQKTVTISLIRSE